MEALGRGIASEDGRVGLHVERGARGLRTVCGAVTGTSGRGATAPRVQDKFFSKDPLLAPRRRFHRTSIWRSR